MKVGLPAGIGDFSWAWSKLCNVQQDLERLEVCDGWPQRTVPYMELCFPQGQAPVCGYGPFNYQHVQLFTKSNGISNPTWADLQEFKDYGRVLLEPNEHLELGRRLEDWMPDLPCEFHYPLYTEFATKTAAMKLNRALKEFDIEDRALVGVSCASYRGSEAWKTWGLEQWKFTLNKMLEYGFMPILIGGFWDDLSYSLACELTLPDLVGKTNVAECIEILRTLPAYVGFSSGLNVIRTVVDRPAFALWPDHQVELATSWVPSDMLESRRYSWSLWREPSEVWAPMAKYLELCLEEDNAKGTRTEANAGGQLKRVEG